MLTSKGSNLAIAFLCTKALMPVRVPLTIGLTPAVARCAACSLRLPKSLPYRLFCHYLSAASRNMWDNQLRCALGGMLRRLLQRRTAEAASSGSKAASAAAAQELHKRI